MSTSRRYLTLFLAPLLGAAAISIMSPASALAVTNEPITGTVTNANTGTPISGITVEVTQGATLVATTMTAPDGTYTTAALPPANNYVVEFNPAGAGQDPGYADQFYNDQTSAASANQVTVTDGVAGSSAGIDDQLVVNGGSITGQVTDATGSHAPLGGIDVQAQDANGNIVAETSTAADGTYTLTGVPAGSGATYGTNVVFNASGPANDSQYETQNYPGNPVAVSAGGTAPNVNGSLIPGSGQITGTVTNSASAPAANVTVEVLDSNGNEVGQTSTAADGTYTVTGLAAGTDEVRFQDETSSDDLAPQYYNGKGGFGSATPVSVSNNATTPNINAALATGATITGTVTGSGAGQAGVDVSVLNCSYEFFSCPSTVTGSGGTYSLQGLPTGTYYLRFSAPGGENFITQYYNGAATEASANPLSITQGNAYTINQNLPTGGQITGTLTDAQTHGPAANVLVEAQDSSGTDVAETITNSSGQYTIAGLLSGSYKVDLGVDSSVYVNQYYGGAVSAATAAGVSVSQGATTGNINGALTEDSSGGRFSGAVVGTNGSPIGGVSVTVYDTSGNEVTATTTDTDGSWKSPAVIPGSYKIGFSANGENLAFQYYNGQSTLAGANVVSVGAGATDSNINATLTAGGTMTGTVTDATTHVALADVEVELLDTSGHVLATAQTLPSGTYAMSGIPTGSFRVEFLPNGLTAPGGGAYQSQFYNDQTTLASSNAVSITAGGTTPNINAGLATGAITATTTITPTKKAGKPTLSKSSLSGIGKRKASLKFKLAAGNNGAPKLKSFKVKLPKGLGFIKKGLKKGLKITGGGKYTDKISKGALIVTLKKTSGSVSVSLSSKALSVSKALGKEAKKHKLKSLKVGVSITDASKKTTSETLTFKKPK